MLSARLQNRDMSKSEKFETCFRWVMYQHYYDTRRIFYNQTAWPALYANDYLILSGKGGDCFSDACSFAYLAKALGYKNVYVCVIQRQLTEAVIAGLKSEAEYMIRCSQRRRAIMDILAWDMDPMDCIRKEE